MIPKEHIWSLFSILIEAFFMCAFIGIIVYGSRGTYNMTGVAFLMMTIDGFVLIFEIKDYLRNMRRLV